MIRLAEFLGIACRQVALTESSPSLAGLRAAAGAGGEDCLVINPEVIRRWLGGKGPEAAFSLIAPFRSVLFHAVRPDPFHAALLRGLTAGRIQSVEAARATEGMMVAPDAGDVCGAFAGLALGKANPAIDRVFTGRSDRSLMTLGGEAHFAAVQVEGTELILIGSEEVADLDAEAGEGWLRASFSQFLPHAMALRHIFGEQCWHPIRSHACLIVDDPLLRARYGFLNFRQLLRLMEQHNFATTVAFIPHNYRRSSREGVHIFRENADRLSLCYHGNDHIGAEFAATDAARLNAMLRSAEERIATHSQRTGVHCDRVMVFPQGKFSVEAMAALRDHNFEAAINTGLNPWQQPVRLTLRELAQPALLRYAGFPLFPRSYSVGMQDADIAFKLFFGIPLLLVEHHGIFEDPQKLIEAVARINGAAPGIIWSGAGTAVRGSVLYRRDEDGNLHAKAYAGTVSVELPSARRERVLVHWSGRGRESGIEDVRHNGVPCLPFPGSDSEICISAVPEPFAAEDFSIRFRQEEREESSFSVRYNLRAVVRRRLSEVRDNYVSRSPLLLKTAKALQERIAH